MPIGTPTHLTHGGANSTGTLTTASITPTANALILISVQCGQNSGTTTVPPSSVTGNGITYQLIESTGNAATSPFDYRNYLYAGMSASPSAGAVTLTGGPWDYIGCNIDEITGVATGANGSNAIIQHASNFSASAVTSLTVTLSAFASANNGAYGAIGIDGSSVTPGSGWTEIVDNVGLSLFQTQYRTDNDTTCDWSFASGTCAGIAIEVAVPASGVVLDEPLNVADDTQRGVLKGRTADEALAIYDDVLRGARKGRTLDEAVSVIDDLTAYRKFSRLLEEALAILDNVSALKSGAYIVALDDFLVVLDQEFSVVAYARQLDEPLTAADQILVGALRGVTAGESLTITDTLAAGALRGRTSDESLAVYDDAFMVALRGRVADEVLALVDSAVIGALRGRTLDDTLALFELTGVTVGRGRVLDEPLMLTDDFAPVSQFVRDVFEGLVVIDDLVTTQYVVVDIAEVRVRLGAQSCNVLGADAGAVLGGYN